VIPETLREDGAVGAVVSAHAAVVPVTLDRVETFAAASYASTPKL
jgi:hypothetical protein